MKQVPRFFVHPEELREGAVQLPEEEARHASTVLRLKPGDCVELFDGRGRTGEAKVLEVTRHRANAEVETITVHAAPHPAITLASAILKGKRRQLLVEKCTELGVSRLEPVRFRRTSGGRTVKIEKWRRWAIEACKQCGRTYLPEIAAPAPLPAALAGWEHDLRLLASRDGDHVEQVVDEIKAAKTIVVLVGPEGGLDEEETARCLSAGFRTVSFSRNVLRVETAAIAACAVVSALAGDRRRE